MKSLATESDRKMVLLLTLDMSVCVKETYKGLGAGCAVMGKGSTILAPRGG